MLRWALIEAIQRVPRGSVIGTVKHAIIARRGEEARNIAKVAAARQLLTLISTACATGRSAACPGQRTHHETSAGGMNSSSWPAARREVAELSAPPPPRRRGRPLD